MKMKRNFRTVKAAVSIVILSTTLSLICIIFYHQPAPSIALSKSGLDEKIHLPENEISSFNVITNNGDNRSEENIIDILDGNSKDLTCSPKLHIFYLKISKTGSSTMSNILCRLAYKHNLIPLYRNGNGGKQLHPLDIYQDDSGNFRAAHLGINKFDIQWTHADYSYNIISRFMHNDTILVMTLRHPFNQVRSMFYYNAHVRKILTQDKNATKDVSFSALLDNPVQMNNEGVYEFVDPEARKLQNFMFKYFRPENLKSGYVMDYFQQIKKNFSNVIITEHYDESLVLLKRSLCLEMKDILYLTQKKATYSEKNMSAKKYDNKLEKKLERLYYLDYKLYDMFLKLHYGKIKHEGISFQRELSIYREIKDKTTEFCLDLLEKLKGTSYLSSKKKLIQSEYCISKTEFNEKFIVTGTDCVLMAYRISCYRRAFLARDYPEGCENETYPVNIRHKENCPSNSDNFLLANFPVNNIHDFCDDRLA